MTLRIIQLASVGMSAWNPRATPSGLQSRSIPFGADELFGIGELLQMAGLRRHSGTLFLRRRKVEARLTFQDGCLTTDDHAALEHTLMDVLCWHRGTAVLVSHPLPANQDRHLPVEAVLLAVVRSLDEQRALRTASLVAPAIECADPPRRSRRWPRFAWRLAGHRQQGNRSLAFPQSQ